MSVARGGGSDGPSWGDGGWGDGSWMERSEERRDQIRPWPAQALHGALGRPGDPPQQGDPLPPLWRWLYFLDAPRRGDLGRDGHLAKGVGLPPAGLPPRRMWAGGRFEFRKQLAIGANATLFSTIKSIREKSGRSGRLVFVTLRHEALTADGPVEIEEQDLVYREDPGRSRPPAEPEPAATNEIWRRPWIADPTLLFRYSALTYNGHRIHYDVDYCRQVEGYDGLVVHGPLLATLMLELARENGPDRRLARFWFRAKSPIVHSEAFEVCGRPVTRENDGASVDGADLWVRTAGLDGRLAMEGGLDYR